LTNTERQAKLLSKIPNNATWEQIRDVTIETMMDYKYSFESDKDIYDRAQQFKQWLKSYLECRPLPEGEKVGFVCHSKFMSACQASGVEQQQDHEEHYEFTPGSFTWPLNCQTIAFNGYK